MARKGAADPSGLVLFDKPAGPSSFAIVRDLREKTGARAGHAGTLDPFATGLLLVLLGSLHEAGAALRRAPEALRDGRRPLADDVHRAIPRARSSRSTSLRRCPSSRALLDGSPRRGRPEDPRRVGGEDRRRARVQAPPARRRRRDADAPDDRLRARARRLRGAGRAPGDAPQLGRLRPRGRRGARRPLREPAGARTSARSTSRTPTRAGSSRPTDALAALER